MSKLLVSHLDLDGFGCIILALKFNDILNFDSFESADYGFEKEEENKSFMLGFDDIIITDLSISKDSYEELFKGKVNISILDHHANTSWVESLPGSIWDTSRSGTKIFWEEYIKPKIGRYSSIIEEFVERVDTYDLWKTDSPLWEEAKNLNNILYSMKNWGTSNNLQSSYPFINFMLTKLEKLENWRWTDRETSIIEKSNKREASMLSKAQSTLSKRKDTRGNIFGVFSLPSKISLVASEILKENEDLDYLVVVNAYRGINGKLSIRSNKGFNCTELKVADGHEAAAGANIGEDNALEFLNNDNISLVYNDERPEIWYKH